MKSLLFASSLVLVSSITYISTPSEMKVKSEIKTVSNVNQLSNHTGAKSIFLGNKSLEKIPMELEQHKSVKKLSLNNNFIKSIPSFFEKLDGLEYLNLSENREIDLLDGLKNVSKKRLETLLLSGCNIVFIPSEIGAFKKLKKLDLSNNLLIDLPLYLGKLKQLRELNLSNNNLSNLDFGIWKCKKLEELDLTDNPNLDILNVCMNLQTLPNIRRLSMSHLKDTLPEEMGQLRAVEMVFENSYFSYLPSTFEVNSKLEYVTFESCELIDFEGIIPTLAKVPELGSLRISHSLKNVPKNLSELQQLTSLDLSNNNLTALDLSEDDMPNVKELLLYGNDFDESELEKIQNNWPSCNIVIDNYASTEVSAVSKNEDTDLIVKPPLKSIDTKVEKEFVDVSKKQKIFLGENEVIIPKDAFVYEDGSLVKELVEVKMAVYSNPLDIVLSGIPMKYDSAEIKGVFESAGMFDISASANGKDLKLGSEKEITINLASSQKDNDYNLYQLNEKGDWVYKSTTTVNNSGGSGPKLRELTNADLYAGYGAPVFKPSNAKPQLETYEVGVKLKKGRKGYKYVIDFKDPKGESLLLEHPKLLDGGKLFYPLDQKEGRSTKKMLNKYYRHKTDYFGHKPAREVLLEVSDSLDAYVLTIVHLDKVIELPLRIENSYSYDREQKNNKAFWKKYSKSLDRARKDNTKTIEKYEELLATYEADLQNYQEETRAWYEALAKPEASIRSLTISQMGTWNCDRISRMDEPEYLAIEFILPEGESFDFSNVTVMDYTDNGTMQCRSNKILYDKRNETGILALDGDKMIYVNRNDFESMKGDQGKVKIAVDVIDAGQLTYDDLKSIIF